MWGLAGIAIVLPACYSPSAAVGVPCSPAGECPAGQHCNRMVDPPTCAAADARPVDGPPDGPPSCATSAGCAAAAPVCDMSTQTCRACVADAECGDDICIEHVGQCVSATNVLFLAATGTDAGACTRMAPCFTIDYALTLVANNQKTIAIGDGTYAVRAEIKGFNANSLTISGPDRDPAGVALTAGLVVDNSTKTLVIEGVTISNAGGRGIDNRGVLALSRVAVTGSATGLASTNQNRLEVSDSTVTGNTAIGIDISQTTFELVRTQVVANGGGGVSISNAATTIESSVIARNGGLFSPFGGVRYQNLNGRPQVFRFNTVAANTSSLGPAGVVCPTDLALENSIFTPDGTNMLAVSQACAPTYSLFSGAAPAGTGNVSGDPAFVGPTDFHIGPASAAREVADPAATTTRDIDGEIRPQGAGRDVGADEIP